MGEFFKDKSGVYSVRKFGGYLALVLLGYLIISFTVANSFKEVPTSYLISIDLIIAFYFAKDTIRNIRIGTNSTPSGNLDTTDDK